jgi:hypothetical protein
MALSYLNNVDAHYFLLVIMKKFCQFFLIITSKKIEYKSTPNLHRPAKGEKNRLGLQGRRSKRLHDVPAWVMIG